MINILVVMSQYLLSNFGLDIIALTIVIRILTLPLTLKQLHATKAIQTLQPKLIELQRKHARDRQKLAQEQMRLYRESGVSPAGCMIPMLVQMPIWIALYQSIIRVLAVVPEDFLSLSQHLYSTWSAVFSLVPLSSQFLWLDLAKPDNILILPILVGGTMWVQQKMVTPQAVDPRQHQQNQLMLWMMPLMFAFFTLQFPSGLALYWVISNIISIVIQYYVTGWGGLTPAVASGPASRSKRYARRVARGEEKPSSDIPASTGAGTEQGKGDSKPSTWSLFGRRGLPPGRDRVQHHKKK